jgi:hypothetical protein|tara:strand:- start:402 stop:578 length:177 start_codon:yes stop_codon:yes gene_type:complete
MQETPQHQIMTKANELKTLIDKYDLSTTSVVNLKSLQEYCEYIASTCEEYRTPKHNDI